MKRTTIVVAALLGSAAVNCHAHGFYIGAEAGLALYPDFTEDAMRASPTTNVTVKQDATSLAYGVFAGYWFTPNFGVEAGYANLGSVDGTVEGSSFFGTSFKASYTYSAQAASIAALGGVQLGKGTLYGKLGMYDASVTAEFVAGVGQPKTSSSVSSTGLLYGAGYSWPFTKNLMGRAELVVYDGVEFQKVFNHSRTTNENIGKLSFGVAYAF
jgi:OOP family OmpA-OmpF porin